MARNNDIAKFTHRAAAASAGTTNGYFGTGERPFIFTGFDWLYEASEANTDNTLDFSIAYTTDGSNFTTLFANGNPNGLLDSGAALTNLVNKGDAASSGGAATSVTPTEARVPSGAVIRIQVVTAGTGTIPAVQVSASGRYV